MVCAFIVGSIQPLGSQSSTSKPSAPAPAALKGKLERIKIHGKSLEGNLLGETPAPEVSIYLLRAIAPIGIVGIPSSTCFTDTRIPTSVTLARKAASSSSPSACSPAARPAK